MNLFEEYKFLRYYIPGSLFLIYLASLTIPNLAVINQNTLLERWDIVLSAIVGSFVISPAIGYVIYSFYDWLFYNRIATYSKWRTTFRLINERAPEILDTTNKKKEFLDLLFRIHYSSEHNSSEPEINPSILETMRGMWNHFNARITCAVFVPIFSVITFGLLYICDIGLSSFEIFRFRSFIFWAHHIPFQAVSLLIIILLSLGLGIGSSRPYQETCRLEEYLFKVKSKDATKLLNILKKPTKKES